MTPVVEIQVAMAVAERLRTHAVGGADGYAEGHVFDAVAAAAFRAARPKGSPCVVVLPVSEDARPPVAPAAPAPARAAIQSATGTIGVHTLLRVPNDPYGRTTNVHALATVVGRARSLVAGWRPREDGSDEGEVIEPIREGLAFLRGRLVEIEDGWLEWSDEFEVRWWVRPAAATAAGGGPSRSR